MLTSKRGLFAATIASGLALSATPALAQSNTEAATEAEGLAPSADSARAGAIAPDAAASAGEFDLAGAGARLAASAQVARFERAAQPIEEDALSPVGGESGIELSGNVALVSEYRFRGVDLSGGDIAVQGGIDLAHSSGFYLGTWGSSLDEDTVGYGHTELDVYAGFGGDLGGGATFDIGAIAYLYPNAGPGDFDYFELYGSLGFSFGPAATTLGVAYAPDQDSLGSTDNLYLYLDLGLGVPGTPLTATAHLGYTDGFLTFTDDGKAWDWSIGVEAAVYGPVSLGVAYVGAEDDIVAPGYDFTDDAIVLTLSASI